MPSDVLNPSLPHARSAPEAPPRGRRANPWLTLIAVAFGLFMVGLDGSVSRSPTRRSAAI